MQFIVTDIVEKIFRDEKERARVERALKSLAYNNAHPYLVGGAVRDLILGLQSKDVDIEVHGISLEALQEILATFGHVNAVGKSFGVLKWEHSTVDWAIPRQDSAGRKPCVELDPDMDITKALARRDLTINAMAIDLISGQLIDPFNGLQDLDNRIAASPDPQFFTEDPLRFYRVMQFIGRFNLQPNKALNDMCASMNIADVSAERIHSEFDKLFLKSSTPSMGIRWINDIGRLKEVLPELAACVGTLQEYKWHPEGDVFEHTMQALDAAAVLEFKNDEEKLAILSAVLCHDLGKATMTYVEQGRLRSVGHDEAGVPFAKELMKKITGNKHCISVVAKLVQHHMAPGLFTNNNASDAAYRRLAVKLSPDATMHMLGLVALSDLRGRNPKRGKPLESSMDTVKKFKQKCEQLEIWENAPKPILLGHDLIDIIPQGPGLGRAVRRAYEIQINEGISDKKVLRKRVLKEFDSNQNN